MAEKEYLKFYKEEKYWNVELRDEFLNETRGLWGDTHADKYRGRIFHSGGSAPLDFALAMDKVDKEMAAAVAKHGPVTVPANHVEDYYQRIEDEKQNIIRKAGAGA